MKNLVELYHLDAGGFFDKESQFFYVRENWKSIWELLSSETWLTTNVYLTGSLGTGKSSLAWALFCWYGAKSKKQILVLPYHVQEVKIEGVNYTVGS
jgi:hypothetical protein